MLTNLGTCNIERVEGYEQHGPYDVHYNFNYKTYRSFDRER